MILTLGEVSDGKEVKNIPKNYAKAIINFIFKNPEIVLKVLNKEEMPLFMNYLKHNKNISNIKDFNKLVIVHNDQKKN